MKINNFMFAGLISATSALSISNGAAMKKLNDEIKSSANMGYTQAIVDCSSYDFNKLIKLGYIVKDIHSKCVRWRPAPLNEVGETCLSYSTFCTISWSRQ